MTEPQRMSLVLDDRDLLALDDILDRGDLDDEGSWDDGRWMSDTRRASVDRLWDLRCRIAEALLAP